ncbi:hypothetical protein [Clostridium sp. UBA3887]|uniref:hypothetical protein n=1 Tax=Clostridium sp. UBA3887 TaxID=1946356 RepID=UPI003217CDD6
MKKRLISYILVLMILVSSSSIAFADDKKLGLSTDYDTATSEYDIYVKIKENADNKLYLNSMDVSDEVINKVLNGGVEKELLHRKSLPKEELYNMGYSDNDIKILQSYNGEPIEEFAGAARVSAVVYTLMNVPTKTDDVMSIKMAWWWNKLPLTTITDTIGVTWWDANGANLQAITDYPKNYPTKCVVDYRVGSASDTVLKTVTIKPADMGSNYNMYNIPMVSSGYAFNGCLYASVGTRGKHNITKTHFKVSYAHKYLVPSASIGLSFGGPSIGFGIKSGFDEMVHRHVSIIPWGAVTREGDDR